jgi:hypothetical protein
LADLEVEAAEGLQGLDLPAFLPKEADFEAAEVGEAVQEG